MASGGVVEGERLTALIWVVHPVRDVDVEGALAPVGGVERGHRSLLGGAVGDGLGRPFAPGLRIEALLFPLRLLLLLLVPLCPLTVETVDRRVLLRVAPFRLLACLVAGEVKVLLPLLLLRLLWLNRLRLRLLLGNFLNRLVRTRRREQPGVLHRLLALGADP